MEELPNKITEDLTELANRYGLEIWILGNPPNSTIKCSFANPFTYISKTINIDLNEVMDSLDEDHSYPGLIKSIEEFLLSHLFECEIVD